MGAAVFIGEDLLPPAPNQDGAAIELALDGLAIGDLLQAT